MRRALMILILGLLLVTTGLVSSCGTASDDEDSSDIATRVAQEVFTTLTAQAVAQVVVTPSPSATPAEAPADTPSPTTAPTETPTPAATPTRKPTNTPRPTSSPTPRPGIGSVVRCDGLWEVSIIEPPSMAKRINVLDTAGYLTFTDADEAKGQWLLLLFDLTNLQVQTDNLSWLDDELAVRGKLGSRLVTFEPSGWGTSRAQRSQGMSNWSDDVPPGITIKALAIFDINPEATDLEFVIKGERDLREVCEASIFLEDASVRGGKAVAVPSNAINVRTGPGTNYPVAGQARAGQRLEITGKNSDASWLKVLFEGKDAWVAASVAPPSGSLDEVAIEADIPAPPATPTPKATPTPLSTTRSDQEAVVQIWGIRLYDAKRAKAVYFFGDAEVATGTWLIPFVELRNAGSGTAAPHNNLHFYLQDSQGRTFDFFPFDTSVLGAAWQFRAGHLYDDINPGLTLGVALPFDVPPDLGDVWLRAKEAPDLAWYVGNVSQMPETQ